jgi:hypothetical protein
LDARVGQLFSRPAAQPRIHTSRPPSKEAAQKGHGGVRFLLGVSFVFLFGPLLIAIGITLIFFPSL